MILYHYSVDSYKEGGRLFNDYKKQFRFAEPYLLALEQGEACFWSVFYANMAFSRELCALGLRRHENFIKDAAEGIFEFLRRRDCPACSASRVGCVYYCESKEEAVSYLREDCLDSGDFSPEQIRLLEVEVEERRVFRYDQTFYNRAVSELGAGRDLQKVFALAGAYFAGERSDTPLIEILSDGENRVVRELPIES